MRILAIIGFCLIVFGIVALGFQTVTYFTLERVVDAGPLHIDVQRPHTIVLHPIGGAVAVVAGLVLVTISAKGKTAQPVENGDHHMNNGEDVDRQHEHQKHHQEERQDK
jgi:hypothetical protein